MNRIERRLALLSPEMLTGLSRGIEKESLRVMHDGRLAATPHPAGLGSALTHPHITTDFSESQLELVTGVHASAEGCLEELGHIHQAVYRAIGDEILWCVSMPCELPAEDAIPIARYGSSNLGRMKSVYRMGLAHRYGRRMQMISGIHYNFSLPEDAWPALGVSPNDGYFALIRNFRRHSWLLLYLFGASPAVCASFVAGRPHELETLTADTLYLPYATSLRMGRLGYQSDAQSALAVSYNDLEHYGASLEHALTHDYPAYAKVGIRDGESYRQLSTSLLQIENEFYGTIRPKRPIRRGERPLHALRERGVEYVEVRLVDLDPYADVGITARTMRFFDLFLLHCLLSESPPDTPPELQAIRRNQHLVSARGREPGLALDRQGRSVGLAEWGGEVLDECRAIAAALDAQGGNAYVGALEAAGAALRNPAATPSARVLDDMLSNHAGSHTRFVLAQSLRHAEALVRKVFPDNLAREHARGAAASIAEQHEIEAADVLPFEAFRSQYLAPHRLGP